MPTRCNVQGNSEYTSYQDADKLIYSFVEEAKKNSIWVSVDAEALKETKPGYAMCNSLKMALDTARDTCIRCNHINDRFIRLRSREIQNQLLVRIEYSCDGEIGTPSQNDGEELEKYVENAGGYYKHRVENDVGKINLAFPKDNY